MKQKTTHYYLSRKIHRIFFGLCCLFAIQLTAQTTETFEDDTSGQKSFTSNGQNFTIVDGVGESSYDIESLPGSGWSGTSADNQFIDNNEGAPASGDGTSFIIKTTDGTDITIKSLYIYISTRSNTSPSATSLTITGKKDGNTIYTITKNSGFVNIANTSLNNGFTLINFSNEGGADNSNTAVDEIIFATDGTSNADYMALDALTWDTAPVCNAPDVPTVTPTNSAICNGGSTNLNISPSSNLNDATKWVIYSGTCGGTIVQDNITSVGASISVSPTVTTTYYIRGEGGCVTPGTCTEVTVTVNNLDDASFSYAASAYCVNASDPSPNSVATPGGTFSSTAGLSINASTGQIDVSASTPNTYTVTYTTAGTCPSSSTASVTINGLDDASFSYAASAYCVDAADPSPISVTTPGGTFSSTAGLSINASTGQIDVSASTPETYTVTYTTAGACPNSATTSVTINGLDNASFSYAASAYCVDAADPSPISVTTPGGTFSSTAGLSINASTGQIDVSASTPDTYIVTYTTAGTCPNSSTTSVTINSLEDASFSYAASAYCVNAADPSPTITGATGGTFSSTAGLSISASTGQIDVSASTPDTYTVTYTTAGACPNSATTSVTINGLDNASFSYPASSYTIDDVDPTPTISGATGGTFSSTAGLSISASTGTIDLSASVPNTYTVTYTTNGTCPNSATFSVSVTYSTYTWTGNINNSWEQPGNWNTNVAPHTGGNVIIPSGVTNYPTATSAVTFNSMTLSNGASFIPQSTVTGNITYKRNLPTTNWYLVSAAVSGETLEDVIANHTLASGTGGNLGLAPYSNITGPAWLYVQSGQTGTMPNGRGVSLKLATPGDLSITGTANTSNIIVPITTGSRTNFNLLGNPFTSYVNSATFAADNTGVLTEETLWLWDGAQYVTYNVISPIELAPGQGFFVEASSSGNVTFATANQSHQTTDTFMRTIEHPSFELFVESKGVQKSTKVFYVAGKTAAFDNGYDSTMFSEDTANLNVFTELVADNNGKHLAIQTLPNSDFETTVIPVGIVADAGKTITFSANALNLPANIKVYLEDRVNNTFTEVTSENYSVTIAEKTNGIGQFYIHTKSQALSNDDVLASLNTISVYKSSENEITVAGLQSEKASLTLYTVLGKKVNATSFASNGVSKIVIPQLASGIYLAEVTSELGTVSKKIIIE